MCWKPDYFQIAQPAGSVAYHLWFHPFINRGPAISWGDYPFGYETTQGVAPTDRNQGYVNLGYKHLIWENWPLYQHFQARKKVIFVVPVGSLQDQFADIQSRAGVYRLIKELNLFLHNMENASYSTWNGNDVGRVGLSSLSYGGQFLQNAIETPGNSALASSNEFYDSKLREVYTFDITISSSGFISTIKNWWRQDPDRRFRIYTRDPAYVNFSEDTFKTASGEQKIFNKVAHLQFPEVNVTEAHFDNLRSLVILPDPFFSSAKGYPTGSDPHHWFPRYFMSHAISNSGFPT
jgi:hypothetical protein